MMSEDRRSSFRRCSTAPQLVDSPPPLSPISHCYYSSFQCTYLWPGLLVQTAVFCGKFCQFILVHQIPWISSEISEFLGCSLHPGICKQTVLSFDQMSMVHFTYRVDLIDWQMMRMSCRQSASHSVLCDWLTGDEDELQTLHSPVPGTSHSDIGHTGDDVDMSLRLSLCEYCTLFTRHTFNIHLIVHWTTYCASDDEPMELLSGIWTVGSMASSMMFLTCPVCLCSCTNMHVFPVQAFSC